VRYLWYKCGISVRYRGKSVQHAKSATDMS
jgi:hypothetical protein